MLQAAICSACNFITIFVTKYRTLLHVSDVVVVVIYDSFK